MFILLNIFQKTKPHYIVLYLLFVYVCCVNNNMIVLEQMNGIVQVSIQAAKIDDKKKIIIKIIDKSSLFMIHNLW